MFKFDVGDIISRKDGKAEFRVITPGESKKYGYNGNSKTHLYMLNTHSRDCRMLSGYEQDKYVLIRKGVVEKATPSITIGIPTEII